MIFLSSSHNPYNRKHKDIKAQVTLDDHYVVYIVLLCHNVLVGFKQAPKFNPTLIIDNI